MKFTQEGGVYVRIFSLKKSYGINLCIEVSDTGVGIAKDELERITERFYQTSTGRNRKVGGLGLGLSIVYGMVRVMNGFMRIESEEGRGTTVTVSIPQQVVEEDMEQPIIDSKNLCVACFLMTEKYEVPQVREYYNKMIAHMVKQFDIPLHRVTNRDELEQLLEMTPVTHLFVGEEEYQANKNYLEMTDSKVRIVAKNVNNTKKVKLVSIYRDTYLRVGSNSDGENVYNKANSAFCTGGPEKMMTMMNKNLDLNIVDYVTVDFKGVAEAVELLGGIDVDLKEEEIEHLNNYCVETSEVTGMDYTPLKKVAGVHHLNGVQTVAYARIRYTAGNDFRRAARQREVIYKIVEKAKNSSISTLSKVLDKVFPLIKTSLTKPEILQMGMSMLSYDIEDQTGFPFDHLYGGVVEDAMDGLDCVLPITLESNVIKLHEFLYPEDSYVPSDEVKTYSQKIIEISGFGEESRLDHSEDGSLAAYHESDTESANPAENSADSQEESQTDVTDDTQGYDDSSLEQ